MTQAPIEPRHKDEAKRIWEYNGMTIEGAQNKIAQTLANDEAKAKALAEIWKRTCVGDHRPHSEIGRHAIAALFDIQAVAAPYRASDPVAEALVEALEIAFDQWQPHGTLRNSWAKSVAAELGRELPKRGLEIVERRGR